MRPVQEFFDMLPRYQRIRAMWNTRKFFPTNYRDRLRADVNDIPTALAVSFTWGDSPEGFEYWKEIANDPKYSTIKTDRIVRIAIHESEVAFLNKLTDDEVWELTDVIIAKLKEYGRIVD